MGQLTDNPEFQQMIDEAMEKALKNHIQETPSISKRFLEGVAIGVIVTALGWSMAPYTDFSNKKQVSVDTSNQEVVQNYVEKAND